MSDARPGPPLHIVAVVGLVRNTASRVLMIDSPWRGWELPGGQVEEGESLTDALTREVREETGIGIAVGRLAVVHSNLAPPAKVILGFDATAVDGALRCSDESRAVEWVTAEAVLERIVHPAVARRAADLLAGGDRVVYRAYARTAAADSRDVGAWYPET